MVMDVYSKAIDEDKRLNTKKLDEQFYGSHDESKEKPVLNKKVFFTNLIEIMFDESNRQCLQDMLLMSANKKC